MSAKPYPYDLAAAFLNGGLEEARNADCYTWTLEELCKYFARTITVDFTNIYQSLDDVIKERDLAQARLRVAKEAKHAGSMAELQYLKDNWPK